MGLGLLFYSLFLRNNHFKKIFKSQKSHRHTHSESTGRFLELFIWKCTCQLGKCEAFVLFCCLFLAVFFLTCLILFSLSYL